MFLRTYGRLGTFSVTAEHRISFLRSTAFFKVEQANSKHIAGLHNSSCQVIKKISCIPIQYHWYPYSLIAEPLGSTIVRETLGGQFVETYEPNSK